MKYKKVVKDEDSSIKLEYNRWTNKGRISAGFGYSQGVDILADIDNTGNGYIFKFPSYSSMEQDNYVCLDYSEAEYIYQFMKFLDKIHKGKIKGKEDKQIESKTTNEVCTTACSNQSIFDNIADDDQDCNCLVCKKVKESTTYTDF